MVFHRYYGSKAEERNKIVTTVVYLILLHFLKKSLTFGICVFVCVCVGGGGGGGKRYK